MATIRTKGYLRALVLGVFLTLAAVAIATPTQTHGWGYRYLHGLLGSVALVAAWGWARLTDGLDTQRKAAAAGALAIACALSLVVLTPIRAWQAWAFVRPFAAANAAVQSAPADVVVIDHNSNVLFDMGTLTRNDPFLVHAPKVVALVSLSDAGARQLCATQRLVVFNGQSAKAWGVDTVPWNGSLYAAHIRAADDRPGLLPRDDPLDLSPQVRHPHAREIGVDHLQIMSSSVLVGAQPSIGLALAGSPSSRSTSAGR